jgi:hypothetical protein
MTPANGDMAAWYAGPAMSEKWTIVYEHLLDDGTVMEPGDVFRLDGERGKRYRYIRTVTTDKGVTWVDCHGGSWQHEKSRSIDPTRIAQVEKKKRGKT